MTPGTRALLVLILLCLMGWNFSVTLQRMMETDPSAPAHSTQLTVDSQSFLDGAHGMVKSGEWVFTPNQYHSVGSQVLLSWFVRAFGHEAPHAYRIFNLCLFFAASVLGGILATRLTGRSLWGLTTSASISSSPSLGHFSATLQYEPLAAAALTAIPLLLGKTTPFRLALFGLLTAVLAAFRAHFCLLLLLVPVFERWSSGRPLGRGWLWAALGFASLALPWNVFYSVRTGTFFWFQSDVERQIHRYLNPASQGFNFPFPPTEAPSGLRFVVERPLDYLALLFRRFLYLSGIQADAWTVIHPVSRWLARRLSWPPQPFDGAAHALGLLLAVRGGFVCLKRASVPLAILAVLLIPHLVINSSFRFLIPAIPILTALAAAALSDASARALARALACVPRSRSA